MNNPKLRKAVMQANRMKLMGEGQPHDVRGLTLQPGYGVLKEAEQVINNSNLNMIANVYAKETSTPFLNYEQLLSGNKRYMDMKIAQHLQSSLDVAKESERKIRKTEEQSQRLNGMIAGLTEAQLQSNPDIRVLLDKYHPSHDIKQHKELMDRLDILSGRKPKGESLSRQAFADMLKDQLLPLSLQFNQQKQQLDDIAKNAHFDFPTVQQMTAEQYKDFEEYIRYKNSQNKYTKLKDVKFEDYNGGYFLNPQSVNMLVDDTSALRQMREALSKSKVFTQAVSHQLSAIEEYSDLSNEQKLKEGGVLGYIHRKGIFFPGYDPRDPHVERHEVEEEKKEERKIQEGSIEAYLQGKIRDQGTYKSLKDIAFERDKHGHEVISDRDMIMLSRSDNSKHVINIRKLLNAFPLVQPAIARQLDLIKAYKVEEKKNPHKYNDIIDYISKKGKSKEDIREEELQRLDREEMERHMQRREQGIEEMHRERQAQLDIAKRDQEQLRARAPMMMHKIVKKKKD